MPAPDTVRDPIEPDDIRFGQIVSVRRAGGAAAHELDAALGPERTAVLVPWGFDDRCGAIPWSGPWRWAAADSVEFFRGRLRPTTEWIDGRPTFDVYAAVWEGFPYSPWNHPMSEGRQLLSADELFDVYAMLPTADELAERPYGSVSALVDWRRDMAGMAERYPAGVLLRRAFLAAETARVRSAAMPFAGTYRLRVESAEGDTVGTFYLRTASAGSDPVRGASPPAGVPAAPIPAAAYAAALALGPSADALARAIPTTGTGPCVRPLGLRARVEEEAADGAPHAWSAHVPAAFVEACLATPALEGLADVTGGDEAADAAPERTDSEAALRFPGSFRQEADGHFTFRQPVALGDGTPAVLVGERVDGATLPSRPPGATPD